MSTILINAPESGNCASLRLEELCRNYYEAVKRFVHYHVDFEMVEDITQETFLHFIRAYPGLAHDKHIYAYLVRIATNLIHDYRRSPVYKRAHEDIDAIDAPEAPDSDPYLFCDADEFESGVLRSTWFTLQPRHKRVIGLLAMGYRPREIAELWGYSDVETWNAIREARAAFKRRDSQYQEVA
jgi:RNA polymerase sigma factor (sigma-70 family)